MVPARVPILRRLLLSPVEPLLPRVCREVPTRLWVPTPTRLWVPSRACPFLLPPCERRHSIDHHTVRRRDDDCSLGTPPPFPSSLRCAYPSPTDAFELPIDETVAKGRRRDVHGVPPHEQQPLLRKLETLPSSAASLHLLRCSHCRSSRRLSNMWCATSSWP